MPSPAVPARRGSAVQLDAPAKVNLFLHVGDREADGYHGLVTLFQALELSDRLRVELVAGEEISLEVAGLDAGPPEDNLVRRAARAFLEAAGGGTGVRLHLEKRIPAGGGLGGGSSDAAATLRALDALLPDALPAGRLHELAARLGSDVPFFLGGSALALGEGRGGKLTPLAALPAADVILALPDSPVPTAWAYRALDEQRASHSRNVGVLRSPGAAELTSWDAVARLARNDFEDVVPGSHPAVARARGADRDRAALRAARGEWGFVVRALRFRGRRAPRARAAATASRGAFPADPHAHRAARDGPQRATDPAPGLNAAHVQE
jgi:4-diphosphocytidyl-2-C-methyl-D-erythritol kinase